MRFLTASFLILTLLATSGYRFRCYWLCEDQTSIQNDYTEQRDECRGYAEAKVDFVMKNMGKAADGKSRNSQLVALFSECMAEHGWTVPDGKERAGAKDAPKDTSADKAAAAAAAAASTNGPMVAPSQVAAAEEKAYLMRNAECNFARQNANNSSISLARAQACDIECAQRLQNAPDAPKPAACPSVFKPGLLHGVDKGDEQ